MKIFKSKTWQFEVYGQEGDVKLFGKNIFDYAWESTGKRVMVKDPLYKQEQRFYVYNVNIDGEVHTFAAGEFSNCIWGFYTYKY